MKSKIKITLKNSLMLRAMLITFLCIFIAFLIVSFYSGGAMYNNSYQYNREYSFGIFEQINININNLLSNYNSIATLVSKNHNVIDFALLDNQQKSISTYMDLVNSMRIFLQNLLASQSNIENIVILSANHSNFTGVSNNTFTDEYDFTQKNWYDKAFFENGQIILTSPHIPDYILNAQEPVITYVFPISLIENTKPVGLVAIDFNAQALDSICNSVSLSNSGYSYIVNSYGEVISHPMSTFSHINEIPYPDNFYTARILNNENTFIQENEADVNHIVFSKPLPNTDWYAVGVIPISELNASAADTRNTQILLGIVAALLVSIAISLFMRNKIFLRLYQLQQHMSKVQTGNMEELIKVGSLNEIGHLEEDFNHMTVQLKQLLADISTKEMQKRQAELSALQSQINPHFLYNTLDSIVWMAEINPVATSEMAYRLASFFRLSLSKGASVVPLSQELEHSKMYLLIQKNRYENYFDFKFCVSKDVLSLQVPKLIIQPLIENAIYHGIKPSGRKCNLYIYAYKYKNYVYIQVIDDGIGFSNDDKQPQTNNHSNHNMSGIGIKNVEERIKLYFPNKSGLFFQSTPNKGTLASIYIYDKKSEE